jgi:hypothetical protein
MGASTCYAVCRLLGLIKFWRADYSTRRAHTRTGGLASVAFVRRSNLRQNPLGLCF